MTTETETRSPLAAAARGWGAPFVHALRAMLIMVGILIVVQSFWMVQARPQDLVTGIFGMADFIRRATPPDFSRLDAAIWPTLETVDIAIFGTIMGVILAVPLALMAAARLRQCQRTSVTSRRSRAW